MIYIQLFGPPTIKDDGQVLEIKRRTTRALLFYISASQKTVSRDTLVELFWPDKPFDKARHTLADNLSKLGAELKDKTILQINSAYISLNHDAVNVDWLDFCELMTQVNRTPGAFEPNQTLSANLYQKMSAAVLLWNSRELIENDEVSLSSELDSWLADLRYECASFLKRVLPRLAQHETLTGNHNLAIHWLGLARSFDEYDENINKALIEAYIQANRHSEARTLFQQVKDLYSYDSDEEIPASLKSLEARMNPSQAPVSEEQQSSWRVPTGLSFPFIGQKKALADINQAFQRSGGVIVFGEGGSGKTRLVYEFCRLYAANKRLLVTSCQPLETNMPFAPWISMLRTSVSTGEWKKLDENWASALTLLLPELSKVRKDIRSSPPGRSELPRTVLLEASYQLLRSLAQKGEVVIFMDDAHWADESSLALVSYLLQKSFFGPGRNLLILAARTEQTSVLLNNFLLSTHPAPLQRVETQFFNLEELADLCYFIFSRNVTLPFLEKLLADTGGNAFFANQILHALVEENPGMDFETVEALPMPAAIKEAIQRKYNALSHSAQEVIGTAAVMGREFQFQLLEAASSISTEDFMLALEELEQARIIQPVGEGEIVFSFKHEKLREGLLQLLNLNRRRLLHRRIAFVLESAGAFHTGQVALLAYHFEQGGLNNKAFEAWLQAAQHAWRLMAVSDAMDACHRAERLIRFATGPGDEQIYAIYRLWSQIAYENDDFATLETINLSMYQLGKERNNDLLIGAALTGLSDTEMARNRYEKALEYAQEALGYVQRTGSLFEQARALNRRGVITYMLGKLHESEASFRSALELTKDADDIPLIQERCISYNRLAVTQVLLGYPLRALENANIALVDAQKSHITYEQISAYNVMALSYYLLVNYPVGRESALRGIELARKIESWRIYGYLSSYASLSALELGMLAESWEHAQKAIEIGRRQGHEEIIALGFRALGDIHRHLGSLDKAREAYAQGMTAAGRHFNALDNMIRLGYTQVLMGNKAERQNMTRAIDLAAQAELGAISVPGVALELAVDLILGEKAQFESRSDWLHNQLIERTGEDISQHFQNRILAEAAFAEKDYKNAYELASAALGWYRKIKNVWYEMGLEQIMEVSAKKMEMDHDSLRPRINELLDGLEVSLGDAPLQTEWLEFKQRFSTSD